MKKFFKKYIASLFRLMSNAQRTHAENGLRASGEIGNNLVTGQQCMFDLQGPYILKLGDGIIFRNFCNLIIRPDARLVIEDKVFFNNFCSINCLYNIEIGENTLFGEGVKLYDHNHQYHYMDNELTVEREEFKKGAIRIGKNCWIGSNVTILKNVEIGDNVIIGANTLVHTSVPSGTIVKAQTGFLINHLDDR